MQKISYRRHRFHPDIIRRAVWPYFRDVEDLLAERGIDVSYEMEGRSVATLSVMDEKARWLTIPTASLTICYPVHSLVERRVVRTCTTSRLT